MQSHATPSLVDVLDAVLLGRVTRFALEDRQKRALRDREGQIALSVVRHLLGARRAQPHQSPRAFPLTERTFQAVAGRLGHRVGIKRCRRLVRRLLAAGVLEAAGSYRQRYRNQGGSSGFRVKLYRLAVAARSALSRKRLSAFPRASSPQLKVRWWQHPLFGDYEGLPPPEWTKRRRQQTASQDEYEAGFGPA
jgi:hypothetical protein